MEEDELDEMQNVFVDAGGSVDRPEHQNSVCMTPIATSWGIPIPVALITVAPIM